MSRPRYRWYPIVQKLIEYTLDERNELETPMELCVDSAVKKALSRTGLMADGSARVALIAMVYKRRTHTVTGAGMKLFVSERTAQRWNNAFIYTVAEELQLIPPKIGVTQPHNTDNMYSS